MGSEQFTAAALVADDDPDLREILSNTCRGLGLDVATADNGRVALDLIGQRRFDILLLDLQMPVMDGFELLAQLRSMNVRDRPAVIVVTAAGDAAGRAVATERGAIDYVVKPFRKQDLERRIRRTLTVIELKKSLTKEQGALDTMRSADPATGLAPTQQLFASLEAAFETARADNSSLTCLVICDDGYSAALDQGGRDAGEERLTDLVTGARHVLGDSTQLFRVDAAEIVALLPSCPSDTVPSLLSEVRRTLSEKTTLPPDEVAIAAATSPHPEIADASLLFRALNVSLAQARSQERVVQFDRF